MNKSSLTAGVVLLGTMTTLAWSHTPKNHSSKPASNHAKRITYHLSPALSYVESVPFAATRGQWYKVNASNGFIHFKDAAVTTGEFSADIAIDGTCINPTPKPVRVDFAVTVFDSDGNVLGRGTSSIEDVQDFGGEYVLTGPTVIPQTGQTPSSCDIRLAGMWTMK